MKELRVGIGNKIFFKKVLTNEKSNVIIQLQTNVLQNRRRKKEWKIQKRKKH